MIRRGISRSDRAAETALGEAGRLEGERPRQLGKTDAEIIEPGWPSGCRTPRTRFPMTTTPTMTTRRTTMRISDYQAISALVRQSFAFFLMKAFIEIGGGRPLLHNWHLDAIEHQLDRILRGDNRRLIVSMPPRHLKSIMITTAWVAWMLGNNPSLRLICASYGQDLSDKHARDYLRIMSTDWYQRAFPNLHLTKRNVSNFETSAGGGRLSTSVGGVITGRGADIVIIDDPMKGDDALSEVRRKEVVEWFDNALSSRLDDQAKSSIILVMQRLHEADLAGELLLRGTWDELRLSAIATKDELVPLARDRFHQRREGYPLHAARLTLADLEIKRRDEPTYSPRSGSRIRSRGSALSCRRSGSAPTASRRGPGPSCKAGTPRSRPRCAATGRSGSPPATTWGAGIFSMYSASASNSAS